jgi:DNA-binding MarR family transcriptional regulator
VQATVSPSQALVRDLYAVLFHLLKASSADVFAALGELELSMTQVKTLGMLDTTDDDEVALARLAAGLNVSLPAASRAVDGLARRALVERHEDPADRRMKRVRILDAGRDVVRALHEARLATLESFVAALPPEEARRLAAALEPIAKRPDISRCRPR